MNGKLAPDPFGVQLDETAYPILMAAQLGLTDASLFAPRWEQGRCGPAPPPPPAGQLDASAMLASIPVANVFGGGQSYSGYDGVTTSNQADVEIDHVVALKEAWDSGAFAWDAARQAAYGNDLTDGQAPGGGVGDGHCVSLVGCFT